MLEDPAAYGYYREETGGLMVGLFEPVAAPWRLDGIPEDFSFGTLPPDWERMTPCSRRAMRRVPGRLTAGVRTFFCGPESFTPDLAPLLGETPEVAGYFVAAGHELDRHPDRRRDRAGARPLDRRRAPDVDVTGMTVERVQPWQANREYRRTRTVEVLGHGLRAALPAPAPADGARREAVGAARPAGGGGRVVPRRQRLGGAALVRRAGASAPPSTR